jgi:hypothetical protein
MVMLHVIVIAIVGVNLTEKENEKERLSQRGQAAFMIRTAAEAAAAAAAEASPTEHPPVIVSIESTTGGTLIWSEGSRGGPSRTAEIHLLHRTTDRSAAASSQMKCRHQAKNELKTARKSIGLR